MKKKTSSILLLSAFAALVLAGCNNTPDAPKSSAAESLESSVTSEPTEDTSSIASETPSSAPVSSSSQAASSSSAPASSSRPASSSSAPASSSSQAASSSSAPASSSEPQRNVWEGQAFVGEYKCGNDTLTILDDGTTKWAAETTARPATLTTTNGVHHIVSAATVAAADKLDIYTDGTMAYVVHGTDKYILDKNAGASSYRAFSALEDNTKMFGGILISEGNWKYLASVNGTFHFGITVSMVLGSNINAGGAVFEATIAGTKTTFKVTEAASDTKEVATIEAYNITATRYAGDNGELVVAKTEANEVDFISLAGSKLLGASLVGDVVSLRTTATPTYEKTDKGVDLVYETTTYTLDQTAKTYVAGQGQDKEALFHALTGNTGSYQTAVGADGNLWATFTPTVAGVLHITETTKIVNDTYVVIYKASATTNYASTYGTANGVVLNEDDGFNAIDSTLELEANATYVIKLGAYADREKDYTYTGSANAGGDEAMTWEFIANTTDTYQGTLGDLVISKKGGNISTITLNGEALTGYAIEGNTISTVAKTVDTSDITNVTLTTTTTTITFDPETGTYTTTATPVSSNPFTVLGASDTSFAQDTDQTGNTWAIFTPASDGIISVNATGKGTISDSYLAIYDLTALGNDITKLKSAYNNSVKYSDAEPAVITGMTVTGGHSYIIKYGAYAARDVLIGETTSAATNVGQAMSFNFSYTNLIPTTYAGQDGEIVTWFQNGALHHITLAGETLTGASLLNGVITVKGTPSYDGLEDTHATTISCTDTVYTLDDATHAYVKANPTSTNPVLNVLTEASTGLSGYLGADGNLWASFTPVEDGFINIDETVQATNGTNTDTLVAVYEEKETGAAWSNYAGYSSTYPTGSLKALNSESAYTSGADNGSKPVYVHDLPVVAGKTYIIKIGAFAGNSNYPGSPLTGTNTAWVGLAEAFSFSFDKIVTSTFTGADGELELQTLKGNLRSLKVADTTINNNNVIYDANAGTLTVTGTPAYDTTTTPTDPVENRVDKVYTLDVEAGTYTVESTTIARHIFTALDAADTSFTGLTDETGNAWVTFTPTSDGIINIEETGMGTITDSYLAVYDLTALGNDFSKLKNASSNAVKYSDAAPAATISNLNVTGGHTYVIKHGAYGSKDVLIGAKATTATYIDSTMSFDFSFTPFVSTTYTGDEGDLVAWYQGDELHHYTLAGNPLTNATVDNGVITVPSSEPATLDTTGEEPVFTSTGKTYTLDAEGSAYTVGTTTITTPVFTPVTALGTYNVNALDNGLALMKFVVPEDGSYTISALMASTDNKLGIYTDAACTIKLTGTNEVDNAYSGQAERITFTATAGQVLYIKTAQWQGFSAAPTSTTKTSYAGTATTFTIA